MKFINVSEFVRVEHYGHEGELSRAEYAPTWLAAERISSMARRGNTIIRMTNDEIIKVKETPEEIVSLIAAPDYDRQTSTPIWTPDIVPREYGRYYVRYLYDDGREQFTIADWMRYNACAGSDTNVFDMWLDFRSRSMHELRGVTHYTNLPEFLVAPTKPEGAK